MFLGSPVLTNIPTGSPTVRHCELHPRRHCTNSNGRCEAALRFGGGWNSFRYRHHQASPPTDDDTSCRLPADTHHQQLAVENCSWLVEHWVTYLVWCWTFYQDLDLGIGNGRGISLGYLLCIHDTVLLSVEMPSLE